MPRFELFKGRLSRTLARYAVLMAFLIGLVLSSLQVLDDYQHQDSYIDQTLRQILIVSEPPAARAVNTLDISLAEEVVDGLLKYPFIEKALIHDDFGKLMASSERPYSDSSTHWLTVAIVAETKTYRLPLYGPSFGKNSPGELLLTVNMDEALAPFYSRSLRVILSGVVRNVLLALALVMLFYFLLTRPLQRLSHQLSSHRAGAVSDQKLQVDPRHTDDELGLLCETGNRFIDQMEQLLSEKEGGRQALAASENRLHKLIDSVPQLILAVNSAGNILFANRQFAQFYERTPEQVCGKTIRRLHRYAPAETGELESFFKLCVEEGRPRGIQQLAWSRSNGREHVLSLRIAPFEYFNDPAMLIVANDITEQSHMQRQMVHLSSHDGLTGLPNRVLFGDRLEQALRDAVREHCFGALLFVDLDNFKTLNDSLGHELGDRLLHRIGHLLQASVDENDTVARMGGDEFVILLKRDAPSVIDIQTLTEQLSQKLLSEIAMPLALDGQSLRVGASMGAVIFPQDHSTSEDLIRYADTAMYRAKAAGRNCCVFYHPEMSVQVERRQRLENELHVALQDSQLLLHYQPQVDANGQIIGFEALMRWQHPQRGLIPPFEFIPVMESCGLIVEAGAWLIETCCQQIRDWRDSGYWQPEWHLAINISAHQFYQATFVDHLQQAIQQAGIEFSDVCVEITESVMIDDIEAVVARLDELRGLGIMVAMDDFGTGYSSLSYLRNLPIDLLKIDRAFIKELGDDPKNQAIVQAVILMANALELQVIAEGVETEEELAICVDIGCQYYQGFLFARPCPVSALADHYALTPAEVLPL